MTTANLLVELFVEELPPKSLSKLANTFASALAGSIKAQGLADAAGSVTPYGTPRRLGAHIAGVAMKAADKPVTQKLMPVSVGIDARGAPTPALVKKLAGMGAGPEAAANLIRRMDGKVEALFMQSVVTGATLAEGLQKAIAEALAALPIPKVMTYQLADGWTSVQFVRPAHGLVALHGADIVPVSALGLDAGRETHGHRFEATHDPIVVRDADSYAGQLASEGAVIVGFAARRDEITRQLQAAATASGLTPIDDDALLDEVTALVERPNVLIGQFETDYLEVPQECLILTMKANQKYFPLLDAAGRLTNKFLIVSNIRPADPSTVVGGNERVVRPRLADAKFFFDQDRKRTLESRVAGLAKVVYHNKLGTQGERCERVRAIARAIGVQLGGDGLAAAADQAARMAKADLLTDMVSEFPELQGIMGGYYARHDGLSDEVADAIEDHYRPRFAGDALPRNPVGLTLALADKLETLVGLFSAGEKPTGDKDPFALRRHALGVIRMLVERSLPFSLYELVRIACDAMPPHLRGDWLPPFDFIRDRAYGYFEEHGFDPRAIKAVLDPFGAVSPLAQLPAVMQEATSFIASDAGKILADANKRITNILKKSAIEVSVGITPHALPAPDASLFVQDEERALFAALLNIGETSLKLRKEQQFSAALAALVPLVGPVRDFFEKVLVNAEQPDLRSNRIALLRQAHAYMNQVADLSLMAS